MLLTTTSLIDGKQIVKYHGLVSGEAILGANIFKDLFAGIRDIVGGRSATAVLDEVGAGVHATGGGAAAAALGG